MYHKKFKLISCKSNYQQICPLAENNYKIGHGIWSNHFEALDNQQHRKRKKRKLIMKPKISLDLLEDISTESVDWVIRSLSPMWVDIIKIHYGPELNEKAVGDKLMANALFLLDEKHPNSLTLGSMLLLPRPSEWPYGKDT